MASTYDSSNVTTAKSGINGAVYRAKAPNVIPTGTATVLDVAFKSLGYVSEDGYTNSNSPSTETVKAWGGDTVLTFQNDKPDTFKFKLIEAKNVNVLKAVYNDENVIVPEENGTDIKVIANSKEQEEAVWVIDSILKGGKPKRVVIPKGTISEVADIVHKDNEPIGYEVTITCIPDADGNTHYEYIKQ